MLRNCWLSVLLLSASAVIAKADPVFQIVADPANPSASSPAGSAVGWGFSVTGDPAYWISVTSAFVLSESNPSIGFFFDLIGPQGGPTGGALEPNGAWSQDYNPDPASWAGLGFYAILFPATPGSTTAGTIRVQYERFSGNPMTCGGCLLNEDPQYADLPFTVTVAPPQVSAVPEPSTWAMWAGGACGLLLLRRVRCR